MQKRKNGTKPMCRGCNGAPAPEHGIAQGFPVGSTALGTWYLQKQYLAASETSQTREPLRHHISIVIHVLVKLVAQRINAMKKGAPSFNLLKGDCQ